MLSNLYRYFLNSAARLSQHCVLCGVGGQGWLCPPCRADLPRLVHLKPGTQLRFQVVSGAQARQALQAQQQAWSQWLASREPFLPPGFIDEEALYCCNLVSGMLRAEL